MTPARAAAIALAAAWLLPGAVLAQSTAPDGARVTAPDPEAVDPGRFGLKPADQAYGAFQRGLYITALNLATPLALAGNPAAQTLVAEIYSRGLGVPQDNEKAAEWYGKAAEQNVAEAQFRLAMILLDGGPEFRDPERAYTLMESAADAGNRTAQFNFAQMVANREPTPQGMEKAVSYYERAARAGLPDAQYAMAQIYRNGLGGKKADLAQARNWLARAAQQNFDTAQIDLGAWLVEGVGGDRDAKTGFSWLLRAAQSGNPAAQNRVAKLYRAGIGIEPDTIASAAWYLVARRAGLVDPEMEDHLQGLTEDELKQAAERVETLR